MPGRNTLERRPRDRLSSAVNRILSEGTASHATRHNGNIGPRTAIQHPDKIRRLVVISSPYAKSGWYPEAQEGMGKVSAAMAENMMQTPTGTFSKQWPEPQRFPPFLDKMGKMMGASYDWSV